MSQLYFMDMSVSLSVTFSKYVFAFFSKFNSTFCYSSPNYIFIYLHKKLANYVVEIVTNFYTVYVQNNAKSNDTSPNDYVEVNVTIRKMPIICF